MATLNTRIVLRNDTAAKWVDSTVVLKKGEIGVENDTGYFKIGNGESVWSALPYANKFEASPVAAHFEITATPEQTDAEAIAAHLAENNVTAKLDDIAIVKREIAAGKYSYTAYVHKDSDWAAMDGNYNAENVYFDENIMITTAVGNITLSNGSAEIPAAGKNIKEVFQALWTKEDYNPTVTNPSISISVKNADGKSSVEGEVGDTYTLPTATASITEFGKFKFGSKAEAGTYYVANAISDVVFSELRVGKADTAATLDGTNSAVITNVGATSSPKNISWEGEGGIFTDNAVVQKFSAKAAHGGSARKAVSNLGNLVNTAGTAQATDFASAGKGIAANAGTMAINGTGTFTATGYRKMFGGATTEATLTSAVIRDLAANARASVVNGSNDDNYFYFTANEGDTKAVFAYPKSLTSKTPKFEMKTMSWGAFEGFTSSEVSVADKRGTNADGTLNNAAVYTVWTYTPVAPFDAAETPFRVCFK
jgi:hypothetical protein